MDFSIEAACAAIGGTTLVPAAFAHARIRSIAWDSREVKPEGAFLALRGYRGDGHAFAPAAIKAGARLLIVSEEPAAETLAQARAAGCCVVSVPDGPEALLDLARAWRSELSARVVGITGSVGKTTMRSLVAQVLSSRFKTQATKGNFNNELGMPLTLLSADADCEALVLEMGMDGLGQIKSLCSAARPDRALITNVGCSHLELLGTRENIARAKAEMLEALPDGEGWAFLPAEGDFTDFMARHARLEERGIRVVRFGGDKSASEVYASEAAVDAEGHPSFVLHAYGESCSCRLSLRGAHNVTNACGAAAVGLSYGMPLDEVCAALALARPEEGRQVLKRMPGGYRLFDDAYNASPESMKAALDMLASFACSGRRIAVLGDMGELGSAASAGHEATGRAAADSGLDLLICVGPLSRGTAAAAREAGMGASRVVEVEDARAAREALEGLVRADDVVLVKASHYMGLSELAKGAVD